VNESDTAVIPMQNGVDASERLAPILGNQAATGGRFRREKIVP
jgi:hypothetical protein